MGAFNSCCSTSTVDPNQSESNRSSFSIDIDDGNNEHSKHQNDHRSDSFDLSIFDQINSSHQLTKSCNSAEDCICIERVLTLLKYYVSLDINANRDHQNSFIHLINTKYTVSDLIMDQFHLQKKHDHEINHIMIMAKNQYQFPSCDIHSCPYSSRLYRVDDRNAEITTFEEEDHESVLQVVMDIIDAIHHYIFHLLECGLRDIGDKKGDDDYIDSDKEMDEYYDSKYARMKARISATRINTKRFDRMNTSNKFSINPDGDNIDHGNVETAGVNVSFNRVIDVGNYIQIHQNYYPLIPPEPSNNIEDTYLDSIFDTLTISGILDFKMFKELKNYLLTEMFDTEAMDIDIQMDGGGNIANMIQNKKCIDCIKNVFDGANLFSVGIGWIYWDMDFYLYVVSEKISRYKVSPHFTDLKSEIMEYKYINNIIKVYQTQIYKKAMANHATHLVKSIKYDSDRKLIHSIWNNKLGIKNGDIIPPAYLICIILYTDYTDLSSDFSSTFRAKHKYEPFNSIKRRNERYYWLSKGLKELISLYGQNYYEDVGLLSKLSGPFYTGMSIVMTINQFQMTLYGPTSTTVHKEVATRFGGGDGMLLQFDNSKGAGQFVKGFDVSWISRYGLQEDERYEHFISTFSTPFYAACIYIDFSWRKQLALAH